MATVDRTPGSPQLGESAGTPPSLGSLDGAPVSTAPSAAQPADTKLASRSAENEAAFWRFLYGSQTEAPTSRRREGNEAPATPSADERAPLGVASRFEARAALRSDAPAGPTSVTIGRIEVRGGLPPPVAPRPAPVPARRPPRLGLADYMRQTAPGARRR